VGEIEVAAAWRSPSHVDVAVVFAFGGDASGAVRRGLGILAVHSPQ
jgi:hypothetical protein